MVDMVDMVDQVGMGEGAWLDFCGSGIALGGLEQLCVGVAKD